VRILHAVSVWRVVHRDHHRISACKIKAAMDGESAVGGFENPTPRPCILSQGEGIGSGSSERGAGGFGRLCGNLGRGGIRPGLSAPLAFPTAAAPKRAWFPCTPRPPPKRSSYFPVTCPAVEARDNTGSYFPVYPVEPVGSPPAFAACCLLQQHQLPVGC
jgi:hypothetical protein